MSTDNPPQTTDALRRLLLEPGEMPAFFEGILHRLDAIAAQASAADRRRQDVATAQARRLEDAEAKIAVLAEELRATRAGLADLSDRLATHAKEPAFAVVHEDAPAYTDKAPTETTDAPRLPCRSCQDAPFCRPRERHCPAYEAYEAYEQATQASTGTADPAYTALVEDISRQRADEDAVTAAMHARRAALTPTTDTHRLDWLQSLIADAPAGDPTIYLQIIMRRTSGDYEIARIGRDLRADLDAARIDAGA